MPELVGNLHLHTTTSDGTKSHDEVAAIAVRAGLDYIIYTDHNIALDGVSPWYSDPDTGRSLLRLMGQEINDPRETPEHSHLLCYLATDDFSDSVSDAQHLIDAVNQRGGLTFLAHPLERPGPSTADITIPWRHWDVTGFTGIELWNAMSDTKWQLRSFLRAIIGAYWPAMTLTAPFPELLAQWDRLTAGGHKVVAVGSSDAHGMTFALGPLRSTIYPYEFLFKAINTHLILSAPLADDITMLRQQVHTALGEGHCFVAYDLIGSARGFTFNALSDGLRYEMGSSLIMGDAPVVLQVASPLTAHLRLLKDGHVIQRTTRRHLTHTITEPGVYRVEAYRRYLGLLRGWVYTNPIYVSDS